MFSILQGAKKLRYCVPSKEHTVAISFGAIEQYGLPCPPARILDIGQSNVYDAQADRVRAWLKQRSIGIDDGWLHEFCAQSSCDASGTRLNGSFLGDLCRQIGLDYLALDIFEGRDVLCFDLNRASLSQELRESFDLVLNFGTTEHVFNIRSDTRRHKTRRRNVAHPSRRRVHGPWVL
jgi:hypothetical protein